MYYYMHVDFYLFKITQQMNKKITLYLSFKLFHFFLACLAVMDRPEEATNWLRKEKNVYIDCATHQCRWYTHSKYLLPTVYGWIPTASE